jgi:hypothetical protein
MTPNMKDERYRIVGVGLNLITTVIFLTGPLFLLVILSQEMYGDVLSVHDRH